MTRSRLVELDEQYARDFENHTPVLARMTRPRRTPMTARVVNYASILDDTTRKQAEALAELPIVDPHIALMPDAHAGKGSSVGTVIPTVGAVIPAAVGVDIGCVDADTEYLTPNGWRRIADYTPGDLVMQYDPTAGVGSFTAPQRYIVKDADMFYRLTSKYGVDQMLTPDHKMLVWEIVGRDRRRVAKTMLAEEFVTRDRALKQGYKAEFETVFTLAAEYGTDWDASVARVHVMTSADSTIDKGKAVLHLTKPRKIERAQNLLDDAGIDYTLRPQTNGSTYIRYTPPLPTKGLEAFWGADAETLAVVADEVFHWDGSLADRVFFTRRETDADLVQYALTTTGLRSTKRADTHPRDGQVDYRVFAIDKTRIGIAGDDRTPITEVPSVDGKAYCFTVPTGFLVLRRGGNIFTTGNCGMIAVQTRYTEKDLEFASGDLADLRAAIEKAIPVSAGNYNRDTTRYSFTARRIAELEHLASIRGVDLSHSPKWREQLGTLGGGNHFIELCLDETGRVWLFLHSGSRGVGNKIAQKHIRAAQEQRAAAGDVLADRDHAWLDEGSPAFDRYIAELRWAQAFAYLNRAEMMDRFVAVFADWLVVDDLDVEVDRINAHHNYTTATLLEDGREVWLTRKGAISATTGELGLIPGSMGTRSYVVRGKGNPDALYSAPHGAGRVMSRTQAKKRFTADDLASRMTGIEYRHGEAWIDEIPDAYKPIDQVMTDAEPLVEIVHELRQLLNVKGT